MTMHQKMAGRSSRQTQEISPEEVAFINAIADMPDDDTPRLVFADWLDEHDQPARAEFIRLQCKLAGFPEWNSAPKRLRKREWELLNEWGSRWILDPRGQRRDIGVSYRSYAAQNRLYNRQSSRDLWSEGALEPTFVRGFVTRLSPSRASFKFRNREWLRSPFLRLVSKIYICAAKIGDSQIKRLVASPNLSGVRHLVLESNAIGSRGAVALATSPHLAGLTRLDLRGNRIGNTGAAALARSHSLPHLKELLVGYNGIGDDGARAFLTTQLTSLKDLSLFRNPISDPVADELVEADKMFFFDV